ncbi:MAG: hypothetical protein IMZ71_04760, partial [Chloroflexi bacterium]|nr:hypothetical protein [Chloroflexota bacterium]
ISNGVLNIKDFSSPDSVGRNKFIGALDFTAKCQMKQCSLVELELLDSLCNGTNAFLFKLSDAAAVTTSAAYAGWVAVTAEQVGVKAKVVCDGTPENNRVIELEWQGSILSSTNNQIALFTPTLETANFASSSDSATAVFYTIGTYTAATDGGSPTNSQIRPCGVATVSLDTYTATGAETLAPIQNVKMSFEMLATQDGIRRHLPNALDVNIEYDWMATLNADLLLLDNISVLDIVLIITMLDGVIFTLTNQVGLETNFEVSGDMDKNRVLRFTHKGKILQSSFDGIVS